MGTGGITREADPLILADRRQADAALAFSDTRTGFMGALERSVGTPDQRSSLAAMVSAFESGLVAASSRPESTAALKGAVQGASELVESLNRAARMIETERTRADTAIAGTVGQINIMLGQIQDINARIGAKGRQDQHAAALLDQRQKLVDDLAALIPVQTVARDRGTIALFTTGGAILLDGGRATLDFSSSNVVTPQMTAENGLLSGLSINGIDIPTAGPRSPIDGGRLAALFSIRDDLAVNAQREIDAIAADLVGRFQQAGLDPTRAPGAAGLLTDGGSALAAGDTVGLAGRIAVNAAVDPDRGGAYWRLRDGLGATAPGNAGNGRLITELADTLRENRTLPGTSPGSPARPAADHLAALHSGFAQARLDVDRALSFAAARQSALADLELQGGVDSDAELQDLMQIEQAYAANARMIQTIDEMMKAILRI